MDKELPTDRAITLEVRVALYVKIFESCVAMKRIYVEDGLLLFFSL